MISREEQHAFEIEYRQMGSITYVSDTKYKVSLFDGRENKTFETQVEAISYAKRKTGVFQKNKQIGLALSFNKAKGKVTHLLFPNSKTTQPYEVSTFYWNQIQTNVDPKHKAERIDQLVPIKVTFNDIARVSSYTKPQKVRSLGIFTVVGIISMLAYVICMSVFMLHPSNSSKILSDATGLPYQSIPAIVAGILSVVFAIIAAAILFYPYYKYYKIARDESGGYSYAGKSWKKPYVDRLFANWVALGFMIASIILSVINNYYISNTIYFTSNIHTINTWFMVGLLILSDVSLIFLIAVITWQLVTTHKRTKDFLKAHVDPEDKDLFKAWTTHKRIESKDYIFDYLSNFTFPPTLERLRVISEEIYPKKLKVSAKVKEAKIKDLQFRYKQGYILYKKNAKAFKKKQGI